MAPFTIRAGRTLAATTIFGAFLVLAPLQQGYAQDAASSKQAEAGHTIRQDKDHSEDRIKELHGKLHITAEQEEPWSKVAEIMRENGRAFHALLTVRSGKLKEMTALDDLNSYQLLANEHADGLRRLIPAFTSLYATMTPAQQKITDHVFREHQRRHHS